MKLCCIFGAMPISELYRRPAADDLVIAADGGYAACVRLGIVPSLVVGDFDSLGYRPEHPQVVQFPVQKDDTDTGLAMEIGLAQGCTRFLLYGCMGGRPDHAYANYALLLRLARRGCRAVMHGEGYFVTALTDGALRLPSECRGVVSVFAADCAEGVTLEGLKYPISHVTLTNDTPLGVSNEFTGAESRIAVEHGTLLIMVEQTETAAVLDALLQ